MHTAGPCLRPPAISNVGLGAGMCVFPVTRVLLTSSWAGGFCLLCSVSAELNLKTNEKRRGSRTFVPGRPLLIPVEQCRQGTGRCAHLAPVAWVVGVL